MLLDALDEDLEWSPEFGAKIERVVKLTWRFRKTIITCRSQFLLDEDFKATEIYRFKTKIVYISPFDNSDINKYLRKKYSVFSLKKRFRAKRIIRKSHHLVNRPLLLFYIDELLSCKKEFKYSYSIFKELINKWIEYESQKIPRTNLEREQYGKKLYNFIKALAINIYNEKENRKGLFICADDIERFSQVVEVDLGDLDFKNRSLLNRNASGDYKFSHLAILEYFLALEIIENPKFSDSFNPSGMEQVEVFCKEMRREESLFKFFRKQLRWKKPGVDVDDRSNGYFGIQGDDYVKHINWYTIIKYSKKLEKINSLRLNSYQISDIYPLRKLETLESLHLNDNFIYDLTPLQELENLIILRLTNNLIRDTTPLKRLRKLWVLGLEHNQVRDISMISELKELAGLHLSFNQISDISPIKNLRKLHHLSLDNNQISDIRLLQNLPELKNLKLNNNMICDISPLDRFRNLLSLDLSNNQIMDISPLKNLKRLRKLKLGNNHIMDISALNGLRDLRILVLDNNQVTDLAALDELKLIVLSLQKNPIRKSIAFKRHLRVLRNRFDGVRYVEEL